MMVRDKIRPYHPNDLQGIVDVISAADRAVGDDPRLTPEIMRTFLEAPGVDTENDTFIVERDGQVIAYADCEFRESGRSLADCAVHPDYWNQGVGAELIQRTEARLLEYAQEKLPSDQPISVMRTTKDSDSGAIRLFEAHGYQHIRSSYHMHIELDQPIEPALFPAGIVLRPLDRERDAHAVYETNQETFADHWGFERATYDEWVRFVLNYPEADPSMWLIAWGGDEIAGICLNRPYGEDDPQMGWVGSLGVRRAWRKRGLGTALLRHSFALFQGRGYSRAGLGVDASSLTNAVALYERAGMRVHSRFLRYHKFLRGAASAG